MTGSTPTPSAPPARVPLVEVVIAEQLTVRTLARHRAVLDDALDLGPQRLVVDLADCPRIDAAGIAVLLNAHRRARQAGGTLMLRSASARLQRNLRLARVERVLELVGPAEQTPVPSNCVGGTGDMGGPA